MSITQTILSVEPLDKAAMDAAKQRQAQLAKPPGSLGRLEELSVQLAGITSRVHNQIPKKHLLVFAADNGVVVEGVSSAPQSVTLMQSINLTRNKTGASVLCKHFGCDITVCDVGVNANIKDSKILNRKIAYGTQNITQGPAMTRNQAIQAIMIGMELARETDADVIGVGEMGIGNTTTSSAVLSVLLDASVEDVTGRGGGITDDSFRKKKQVIKTAIATNHPNANDVIDVISKVGGFDIAAMCGAFIGAASTRKPVVIDGLISSVAALCAVRLCPNVRDYLIPSHASFEIGYRPVMKELDIKPLFDLNMRLGEGSGCPIAMMMLDAACAVMNDMATFEEANINDDYLSDIRATDSFTVKGESE
ncbi:MAG: nicotinate-nucleotide--dimethylbenzimidazole phosphoribosyltransferase [Clostridia bacterium]|nr:nicotinate-nucleotide--dimethylbenzimidazole phosphoribosyltransferase [Clostridia bacterium]MBQ7981929.1 nicotinate-nucleotide--dimethylbenzimidazole phosphoribosyltransferase [Clostridia bacterium]